MFEGDGVINDFVGGYSDWEARGGTLASPRQRRSERKTTEPDEAPPRRSAPAKPKLGYREQRELAQLPERIEALEERIGEYEARVGDPAFYDGDREGVERTLKELADLQAELDSCYERWAELEG